MERYTIAERIQILEFYYENSRSITNTLRKIRAVFPHNRVPSETTIRNLTKKFKETGSVQNVKTPKRTRVGRSTKNIALVSESVEEDPNISIRRRSQQLNLSTATLHRILTKDLGLHAYKVQLTQELKPSDHLQRRTFTDWVLENLAGDSDFCKKIMFSDEAHFHLNGYVNKQNCRIWGSENPRMIQEKPMHPERVTVWCGFWSGGVIGPYFFQNDAGRAVTVNGVRYRDMLTNFLWSELENMDTTDLYFQQDGATCHTSGETIVLLRSKFPGRVISRNGDINWPARSCDLTPLDFFLWGYIKGKVYANNPQTINALKANIETAIAEIQPHFCENIIENFKKRVEVCKKSRGGHLDDVLFHT